MSTVNTILRIIKLSRKGKTVRDKVCAFFLAGYPMIGEHRRNVKKAWLSRINKFCKDGQLQIKLRISGRDVLFSMREGNTGDYTVGGELVSAIYPKPDFQPETIIDGGANIGMFTVLASAYFPDALIYSYEPEQSNFDQLLINIRINNIKSEPRKMGLWSRATTLYFHQSSSQIGYIDDSPPGKPIICDLPKVGERCWVKLDIEGAEYEVLPMLMKQKTLPVCISLELHHMHKYGDYLTTMLKDKNYTLCGDVESKEDCYVIQANLQR